MPIKPFKPAPDEFVLSHLGRFRAWHDNRDLAVASRRLRKLVSAEAGLPQRASFPHLAAAMAGLSTDRYIQLHTMLPFMHFAAASQSLQAPGSLSEAAVRSQGCATPRDHAYLCPACVEEDLVKGYSYWRREHQLPGRFWCACHSTVQLLTVNASYGFWELPQHWLKRGEAKANAEFERPTAGSTVARFHEISRAMLDSLIGRRVEDVSWALEQRARKCIQPSGPGDQGWPRKRRLSDLVQNAFPSRLYSHIFNNLSTQSFGGRYGTVNLAVVSRNRRPAPIATAMAMTVLFDTVEEAFSYLDRVLEHSPEARPQPLTANLLAQTLIESRGNLSLMASALNVPLNSLRRRLKLRRVSVIRALGDQRVTSALHLIQEGATVPTAIELTGAETGVVERIVWLIQSSNSDQVKDSLSAVSPVIQQAQPGELELEV